MMKVKGREYVRLACVPQTILAIWFDWIVSRPLTNYNSHISLFQVPRLEWRCKSYRTASYMEVQGSVNQWSSLFIPTLGQLH